MESKYAYKGQEKCTRNAFYQKKIMSKVNNNNFPLYFRSLVSCDLCSICEYFHRTEMEPTNNK